MSPHFGRCLQVPVESGELPRNLVAEGINQYVHGPLSRFLEAAGVSKKISEEVESITEQQKTQDAALESALAQASGRAERQTVKVEHHNKKEQFFLDSIAKLEGHINTDRAVLSSLEAEGTPLIQEANQMAQSLVKESTLMHEHITSKGLSYGHDPAKLVHMADDLKGKLDANTTQLHASLQKTMQLMKEHLDIQKELVTVKTDQQIRQQVEEAVEAKRQEMLQKVAQETQRLQQMQTAVESYQGSLGGFSDRIKSICKDQQEEARTRVQNNSVLFSQIFTEYYAQLYELHSGKVKCTKALQTELKRLLKEQTRWEALEHELPGAQHLVRLDDRLTQIKEFQTQLAQDIESLEVKIKTLEGCGSEILENVKGFVHPKETFALDRAGQLNKKRHRLQGMLSKYGPVQFTEEDLNYESESAEEVVMPEKDISREVQESPYKIKRHLQRITDEISNSPYADKFLGTNLLDELPEQAGSQVPEPTQVELETARRLKRAPGTRGSAFNGSEKKKRRHNKH